MLERTVHLILIVCWWWRDGSCHARPTQDKSIKDRMNEQYVYMCLMLTLCGLFETSNSGIRIFACIHTHTHTQSPS